MACRDKAAKHYPADHRRENEPELRINNCIDSHVVLHGRPWLVKFSAANKAPGISRDSMSHGEARRMVPRNRGKRHRSGERQDLAAPGSGRNAAMLYLSSNPANAAAAHWFGNAHAGVNLCGRRPNNTSDFDTIGHAPALGFR
jgi:hypothetical protein